MIKCNPKAMCRKSHDKNPLKTVVPFANTVEPVNQDT